jgi:hypothetical protein
LHHSPYFLPLSDWLRRSSRFLLLSDWNCAAAPFLAVSEGRARLTGGFPLLFADVPAQAAMIVETIRNLETSHA